MINHGRTLLLNANGASRPDPAFFLEEYVDPKYAQLELPNYLRLARAPLFGPGADDAYKNYMMKVCMTILHSTEFASYLYALDSRVTYLNRPSVAEVQNVTATAPTNDLAELGRAEITGTTEAVTDRAQWIWDLEVVSAAPPQYSVQVELRSSSKRQLYGVNFGSGFSELVPLAGQNKLFFRFLDSIAVGAKWSASAFTMPQLDYAALIEAFEKNGDVGDQLFGNAEPYKTFKELWLKHAYQNYRLSGYLLALIYRTEEVRASA